MDAPQLPILGRRILRSTLVRCLCVVALALALTAVGCGSGNYDNGYRPGKPQPSGGKTPVVNWGKPAGGPTGVVILLPGGGWREPSETAFLSYLHQAQALETGGFATATVRYGPGAQAVGQIEDVYAQAHQRYPDLPICLIGGSAGAHLALLIASREPDVACVVDSAGPTDLTSLAKQGSQEGYGYAVTAFGKDRLAKFSPIQYADEIKAPVLMIYAESDQIVPVEQGEELARVLPSAELIKLATGDVPWIHSGVSAAALQSADARTVAFLQEALG